MPKACSEQSRRRIRRSSRASISRGHSPAASDIDQMRHFGSAFAGRRTLAHSSSASVPTATQDASGGRHRAEYVKSRIYYVRCVADFDSAYSCIIATVAPE